MLSTPRRGGGSSRSVAGWGLGMASLQAVSLGSRGSADRQPGTSMTNHVRPFSSTNCWALSWHSVNLRGRCSPISASGFDPTTLPGQMLFCFLRWAAVGQMGLKGQYDDQDNKVDIFISLVLVTMVIPVCRTSTKKQTAQQNETWSRHCPQNSTEALLPPKPI